MKLIKYSLIVGGILLMSGCGGVQKVVQIPNTSSSSSSPTSSAQLANNETTDHMTDNDLSKASDGRYILKAGNYGDASQNKEVCELLNKLYNAPANTTTLFTSKKWGVSISMPYNIAWGDERYVLPSFVDSSDSSSSGTMSIDFGKAVYDWNTACGFFRQYSLGVEDVKATEQGMAKGQKPVKKMIDGREVLEFSQEQRGSCQADSDHYITLLGKKYSYTLTGDCNTSLSDFEAVVKSIKLL